jgi:hypothetical protein
VTIYTSTNIYVVLKPYVYYLVKENKINTQAVIYKILVPQGIPTI